MAREVQPLLTEPTKPLNEETVKTFDAIVADIEFFKDEIATATESKNKKEAELIADFFGTKAKGSTTLSGGDRKVKVEYNNGVKADLKELSEELPTVTFNLVFPPKREFSASAHNAHIKALEEQALTKPAKKEELAAYLAAVEKYVHFTPNKPSVKIEKL